MFIFIISQNKTYSSTFVRMLNSVKNCYINYEYFNKKKNNNSKNIEEFTLDYLKEITRKKGNYEIFGDKIIVNKFSKMEKIINIIKSQIPDAIFIKTVRNLPDWASKIHANSLLHKPQRMFQSHNMEKTLSNIIIDYVKSYIYFVKNNYLTILEKDFYNISDLNKKLKKINEKIVISDNFYDLNIDKSPFAKVHVTSSIPLEKKDISCEIYNNTFWNEMLALFNKYYENSNITVEEKILQDHYDKVYPPSHIFKKINLNTVYNLKKNMNYHKERIENHKNNLKRNIKNKQIVNQIIRVIELKEYSEKMYTDIYQYFKNNNNYLQNKLFNDYISLVEEKIYFNRYHNSNLKNIDKYVSELKDNGIVILKDYIPKSLCDKIKENLYSKFPMKNCITGEVLKNQTKGVFRNTNGKLILEEDVANLILDESILYIVQEYLGSIPKLIVHNNFVSFPDNEKNCNSNAQLFHQDWPSLSLCKIFIYLNDTNIDNGCHRFVKNSFKNMPEKCRKKFPATSRVPDENIKQFYGKDSIMNITGKAGTIIIEDSMNFHSGSNCKTGKREVLHYGFAKHQLPYKNTYDKSSSLKIRKSFCDKYKLDKNKQKIFI